MHGRHTVRALLAAMSLVAIAHPTIAQTPPPTAEATLAPPRVESESRSSPDAAPATAIDCTECPACDHFDFKNVPPVRVFPRPGMFPIPPTGPGYYSLLDAVHGKCREKPPQFGY